MKIGYARGFVLLSENIDTTSAGGMLAFHIMGALADFECALIGRNAVRLIGGFAIALFLVDPAFARISERLYCARTFAVSLKPSENVELGHLGSQTAYSLTLDGQRFALREYEKRLPPGAQTGRAVELPTARAVEVRRAGAVIGYYVVNRARVAELLVLGPFSGLPTDTVILRRFNLGLGPTCRTLQIPAG